MVQPVALSDDQYLEWLSNGWLELTPASLDTEAHQHLYDRAGDLYELAARTNSRTTHLDILGDNLRARIPELDDLLADPVVDGALTSILGPDYLLHPHSYCHRSGRNDQVFHQDGNLPWNERGHQRVHRPDWAMLFYYPQEVDASNGPTEVVRGSQYWTIDHEMDDGEWHRDDRLLREGEDLTAATTGANHRKRGRLVQRILDQGLGIEGLPRQFVHVPAGTVVLAHYDLFHRGSRAKVQDPRYMYKFYFARTVCPSRVPPERIEVTAPAALVDVQPELRPAVTEFWRWSRGPVPEDPSSEDVAALVDVLVGGLEDDRVATAYRLGSLAASSGPASEVALEVLGRALADPAEGVRRAASHGLRVTGSLGVDLLIAALGSPAAGVRRVAAAGLGGMPTNLPEEQLTAIIDHLVGRVATDADDLVRSNAAYSLGQLARSPHADADRIATALLDRLAPGAEAINATSWELSRSTVRQSAAFAMVQVLANHQLSESLLDVLIDGPMRDDDRYVQGLSIEALSRAQGLTGQQLRRVVTCLNGQRWIASPESSKAASAARP